MDPLHSLVPPGQVRKEVRVLPRLIPNPGMRPAVFYCIVIQYVWSHTGNFSLKPTISLACFCSPTPSQSVQYGCFSLGLESEVM